jgi:hypothetical protein
MTALVTVVLGMLLVYLIFAIVVSRLQEWLSHVLATRGKFLREGIHRIVADDGLSTRVLRHPLISSLYRDTSARAAPPSYIEPAHFALALANILMRRGSTPEVRSKDSADLAAKSEARTQKLTYENLRAALESFGAQRSPIADALLPVVDRANGDLNAALKGIEDWFSSGMDRVSGWYKTSARRRLLAIGFVIAAVVNVDSIAIFQSLNDNPVQAKNLADVAEQLSRTGQIGSLDVKALSDRAPNDEEWKALRAILVRAERHSGLPIGWQCLGTVTSAGGYTKAEPSPNEARGANWSRCGDELAAATARMSIVDWVVKVFGWLLTAFAGSLGASYWFAAISKVINLRSSGPRPIVEKEKAKQGA